MNQIRTYTSHLLNYIFLVSFVTRDTLMRYFGYGVGHVYDTVRANYQWEDKLQNLEEELGLTMCNDADLAQEPQIGSGDPECGGNCDDDDDGDDGDDDDDYDDDDNSIDGDNDPAVIDEEPLAELWYVNILYTSQYRPESNKI